MCGERRSKGRAGEKRGQQGRSKKRTVLTYAYENARMNPIALYVN